MAVLDYFNIRRGKHADKELPKSPILNEEDEKLLTKITSADEPPALPDRPIVVFEDGEKKVGKDAQEALMDGADGVPLPTSPPAEGETKEGNAYWSYIRDKAASVPVPSLPTFGKGKAKDTSIKEPEPATEEVKSSEDIEPSEAKKEEDELTTVLDELNLSAVNNRVFSFSKESTKLMEEFTLILKDIVNGVPTAYDDLEKLLTRQEGQLTKMFGAMPPFLQTLVKNLPAKMTGTLGPELMAAMSEKPGHDAKMMNAQSTAGAEKKKEKKSRIPSVKSLVSQEGLVASMLRSILNFLKLRFPVLMTGTNILMSLAVFILLFVFWYCHKRGKETRLAGSSAAASSAGSDDELEKSVDDIDSSEVHEKDPDVESPITLSKDPSVEEKPSAAVQDLESILKQPEGEGERVEAKK